MDKALLVIGLQTDLLPGGAMAVPDSEGLAAIVNDLLPHYRHVIAARFALPANHLLFAANYPWRKPGQMMKIGSVEVPLQIMYCVQGSFGAEFAPGLRVEAFEHVVEMGAEPDAVPHSAFFDTGNPKSTGLKEYLQRNNIQSIDVCGMPFETTVWNTVQDALSMGFEVHVVQGASRCMDADTCERVIADLRRQGLLK